MSPNAHSVSPNGHSVSRNRDFSYSRILKVKEQFKSKRVKSSDIVGGYGIPAIPTQSAVHSYCQCDCHHSIGLYTHVCVGMAGMPYPPTDTHSSVFKKPVLLSFQKQHVLMFFLSFKKTCSHVLLSFQKQSVLMSSCLSPTTCSHVLLSFQKQHVLMFSCLSKTTCSSVFQKEPCSPFNPVFMLPKKTAESNAPSR